MAVREGAIRLQVEAYGILRFVTLVETSSTVGELKKKLEAEIFELYSWKAVVVWLKDFNQNDYPASYKIKDVFKDMDQIYILISVSDGEKGKKNSSITMSRKTTLWIC
jgi:hypothetical protein